jgi:hypothetical protein
MRHHWLARPTLVAGLDLAQPLAQPGRASGWAGDRRADRFLRADDDEMPAGARHGGVEQLASQNAR